MSGKTVADIVIEAMPHLDDVQRGIVEHNLSNAFIAITNVAWWLRHASSREDGIMLLELADDCHDAMEALGGKP